MTDTYDTAAEAEADRAQQLSLLSALNATGRALRRDECGAWCISGERGSIHTWGDGKSWVLYVACRSARHWTSTKPRLGFCEMRLDCETEGTLRLHRLPTAEQAAVIRDVLGIEKRREISDATRERLRAFAFERSTRREAVSSSEETSGRPSPPGGVASVASARYRRRPAGGPRARRCDGAC
jgi:hypothetical protein